MRAIILIVLFGILLISCNTKASTERKIKKTVTNFWNAVEKNDGDEYKSLIYQSEQYPGIISMERKFLNKNYKKINSYINLKENIKVKDTIWAGTKMKYVQYRIKNGKPNYTQNPLLITFIFYDQKGYDKIINSGVLDNFLKWE